MKIKVIFVNKTAGSWVKEGLTEYKSRLKRYLAVDFIELEMGSSTKRKEQEIMEDESSKILSNVKSIDHLVLLDENGSVLSSEEFAKWMNKKFISIQGDLIFVVGGAYGFHSDLKERANEQISLSSMTFTHQMVRVIFVEQLYRAMTILKNEPYHHS
ncbi:MAG: 23S rRNA (pseudouridine(1915)-N(3))-methyltransferase RlmH [Bacteroidetes bacterium]|nr:23S rRNA (pseudouridine(1915)-N(3))-methyltransferase RlmH [Bacteroidota bacterium]